MGRLLYLPLLFLFVVACTAQGETKQNSVADEGKIVVATPTALAQPQSTAEALPPPTLQATATAELKLVATPASPMESVTVSTSISVGSMDISYSGTNFVIPAGLATGTQNEEMPPSNNSDSSFLVYPAYTHFVLQGYPLHGNAWEPQISIYPASEFGQLSEGAKAVISQLQAMLSTQRVSPAEAMPFLPPANAKQLFHAQEKFLSFKNGSGVRYVTQYDQAPLPINNTELFYTSQALTDDGHYYVSVSMPINVPFLPTDNTVPSTNPSDGIPFEMDMSKYPDYLSKVANRLNRVDNTFTPTLVSLDTLVQSLTIVGP